MSSHDSRMLRRTEIQLPLLTRQTACAGNHLPSALLLCSYIMSFSLL
jgi:hypothetical protein